MKFSMQMAAVAALSVSGITGLSARATVVNYTNVSSNGITISNISEDNSDNFASGHYGQPVFSNGVLSFPSLQQFGLTENGSVTSASGHLDDKLTFTVTMPLATAALFNLTEQGIFGAFGGGSGSIVLGGVGTVGGNALNLAPGTGVGTVVPNIPFFGNSPSSQTTFAWIGTLNPVAATPVVTYTFALDNDITATAPAVSVTDPATFSDLEKKSLVITFPGGGSPPSPEPASLGMLVLGSLALIGRRRKA